MLLNTGHNKNHVCTYYAHVLATECQAASSTYEKPVPIQLTSVSPASCWGRCHRYTHSTTAIKEVQSTSLISKIGSVFTYNSELIYEM